MVKQLQALKLSCFEDFKIFQVKHQIILHTTVTAYITSHYTITLPVTISITVIVSNETAFK